MRLSKQTAANAVGALALAGLILYFTREVRAAVYNDLGVYLQAARAMSHGADPYSGLIVHIASYHHGANFPLPAYVYAPIFAILLMPLAFLPLHVAGFIWTACKMVFLAGIAFCVLRAAKRPSPIWLVLCLALGIILLNPVRFELETGQADVFVAFLVSASFLAARSNRPILCGLLLALAAATKTPLLALVLFYAWKSQWRIVISSVAGWVVFIFSPFIVLGGSALRDQMTVWSFWSNQFTPFAENSSIKGVLSRVFSANLYGPGLVNSPTLVTVLWLSAAILFGLAALVLITRDAVHETPLAPVEFSLAVCSLLLVSPLTEATHLVILAVPLLLCASAAVPRMAERGWRGLGVGTLAVFAGLWTPLHRISVSPLLYSYIAQGGVRGALAALAAGVYLYFMLAAYALCVVWLLHEKGRWPMVMRGSSLSRGLSEGMRILASRLGLRRVASAVREG